LTTATSRRAFSPSLYRLASSLLLRIKGHTLKDTRDRRAQFSTKLHLLALAD
jgi:hypothetical protein